MKSQLFLSSLLIALISCSTPTTSSSKLSPLPSSSITSKPTKQSPITNPTPVTQNSPPASGNLTISAEGIGKAELGMTVGQLKQILGSNAEFKVVSPFMVDLDAIAISKSGKVQLPHHKAWFSKIHRLMTI